MWNWLEDIFSVCLVFFFLSESNGSFDNVFYWVWFSYFKPDALRHEKAGQMKEASTAASSSDEAIPDNLILLPTQGQNESRTKEDEVLNHWSQWPRVCESQCMDAPISPNS